MFVDASFLSLFYSNVHPGFCCSLNRNNQNLDVPRCFQVLHCLPRSTKNCSLFFYCCSLFVALPRIKKSAVVVVVVLVLVVVVVAAVVVVVVVGGGGGGGVIVVSLFRVWGTSSQAQTNFPKILL